jgi:uncharacterized repeat protein (TIGR03803 family)
MSKSFHSYLKVPSATLTAAITVLIVLGSANSASAYTEKTLHSFCTEANCGDGDTAHAGLLMDASGNLYGTTVRGGKYGHGLVFKLVPNAGKTKYKEYILHNFCAEVNCPIGAAPQAELIADVDGRLYGTTEYGGKYNQGIVFRMTHGTNGWSIKVIHSFCLKSFCTDGEEPFTGLSYAGQASGSAWDESSPLFGTTDGGGANGKGVAYKLSPNGSGWTYQVIHSFKSPTSTALPGPLLVAPSGTLFGVTGQGGKYGVGVLYKLASGTWTETTLHNFTEPTGQLGWGRLAIDAAGNLFGVTTSGGSGASCTDDVGCGVAFERTAGGTYEVIYNFCSKTNCKDGYKPEAGMVMDGSGNLFGTTFAGGAAGDGMVFMLSHSTQWTEKTLYSFCGLANCKDGGLPSASVAIDKQDNVYGTASADGAHGDSASGGTVFRLTP